LDIIETGPIALKFLPVPKRYVCRKWVNGGDVRPFSGSNTKVSPLTERELMYPRVLPKHASVILQNPSRANSISRLFGDELVVLPCLDEAQFLTFPLRGTWQA